MGWYGARGFTPDDRTNLNQTSSDTSDVSTYTKIVYDYFTGAQYVYPDLAAGTTITSSDVEWKLGAITTIIPLNTETSDFHIHRINADMSADGEYQLKLYVSDSSVISDFIGTCVFDRETNKTYSEGVPINCSHNSANDAVRVRLASANAAGDTANIKLGYHRHID